MESDNINIGLDLLMNPQKRSSQAGSISGSDHVFKVGSQASHHSKSSKAKSNKLKQQHHQRQQHKHQMLKKKTKKKVAKSETSESSSDTSDASSDITSASGSSGSSSGSSSSSSSSGSSSSASSNSYSSVSDKPKTKKMSQEDIINMKKEILYQFDRLEKKGIKLPRKFTLANSLDDMRVEYDRLKKDREVDISVKFQRRTLMAIISGIEYLNGQFDPFDISLDGWSECVNDDISEYDDVFEELHEKYKGRANVAPEIKLMMALGGSAFIFHMKNTLFKSSLPGASELFNKGKGQGHGQGHGYGQGQGQGHQQQKQQKGGGGMNIGSVIGSLFGGGGLGNIASMFTGGGQGNQSQSQQHVYTPPSGNQQQQQQQPQMRGPSNVDAILKEINRGDRVENISTISESEFSALADEDDTVFVTEKKKGGGRTLHL